MKRYGDNWQRIMNTNTGPIHECVWANNNKKICFLVRKSFESMDNIVKHVEFISMAVTIRETLGTDCIKQQWNKHTFIVYNNTMHKHVTSYYRLLENIIESKWKNKIFEEKKLSWIRINCIRLRFHLSLSLFLAWSNRESRLLLYIVFILNALAPIAMAKPFWKKYGGDGGSDAIWKSIWTHNMHACIHESFYLYIRNAWEAHTIHKISISIHMYICGDKWLFFMCVSVCVRDRFPAFECCRTNMYDVHGSSVNHRVFHFTLLCCCRCTWSGHICRVQEVSIYHIYSITVIH